MEKFMLLFRGSDVYQPGQTPEALQALKQKLIHWVGDLSKKGVHVASEPLEPAGKQVSGTKKTVTDSPFGEGREIIGGCKGLLDHDTKFHGSLRCRRATRVF